MPDASALLHPPLIVSRRQRWYTAAAALGVSISAFFLYFFSLAPGLTWSHQGADGGELITAALVNGVPHPPGYPLYMLLLQGWLGLTQLLAPGADLNWRGAIFSALCAALSAGITLQTARYLLRDIHARLLWSVLAAAAWAVSPLLWAQAVITEVYALHALLLALLGWAVLVHPRQSWYLVPIVALGAANHLTFVLLLPAAFYLLWMQTRDRPHALLHLLPVFGLGLAAAALFYIRTPLAAAAAPPVNWGYADNWEGFWWLVSGAAYRGYLFASPADSILARLAAWAYTITAQYTPAGLAVALIGLAHWDRTAPHLRNFSLLWLTPISLYALAYYTRDSDIYLLPAGWLMAIWLAVGLGQMSNWVMRQLATRRWGRMAAGTALAGSLAAAVLLGITAWRWSEMSLAEDRTALAYVEEVKAVLTPDSIVITLNDNETFALWYGIWGSGELAAVAPGVTTVNESLYQFEWYRRLQAELHPDIAGAGQSVDAIISANHGKRPIYFAQLPAYVAQTDVTVAGPLWRLNE